ncbi:MAG: hypothetical protein R3E14_05480 [Erythrobacter sp.]
MSNRVFVRGAGVACLAAALVGYSLATDDNLFLPRLPGDGDDDEGAEGQKPYLRAPLPEPSFGASATRLPSKSGTSTSLKARRGQLLGSASSVPVTADAGKPAFVPPVAAPASASGASAAVAPAVPGSVTGGEASLPAEIADGEQTPATRVPGFAETFGLAPPQAAEPAPASQATPPDPGPVPAELPAEEIPTRLAPAPLVETPTPPPLSPSPPPGDDGPGPEPETIELTEAPDEAPFAQAEAGGNPTPESVPAYQLQTSETTEVFAELTPAPAPETTAAGPSDLTQPSVEATPPSPTVAVDSPEVTSTFLPPPPLAPPPAATSTPEPVDAPSPVPPAEAAARQPEAPVSLPEPAPVSQAPATGAPLPITDQPVAVPAPSAPEAPASQGDLAASGAAEPAAPLAPIAPQTATASSTQPSAPMSELVPASRDASILGLPGTGEQVTGGDASPADDPAALGMASTGPFSGTAGTPLLSYQDELILEVQVDGYSETDTIIAYGTRGGLYLPLGAIARILDLAVTVADEGRYAHGWVLSEDQTLTIDLRSDTIELPGRTIRIDGTLAAALDGELYLRMDQFGELFPVEVKADLRAQAVRIKTLQTFPFEARRLREQQREKLAARQSANGDRVDFERVELPYKLFSMPAADVELRAVSDRIYGPRLEGDLLLAGDVGYLSANAYLSADSKNGLVASLLKLGRMDPDAELLGPLKATSYSLGDVNSTSMALGLRSVAGRGFTLTNAPSQVSSVFDKVDIRGILPDGYEVELYRNDVLVGSTRDAVNGQYEFLRVPVDFGLNVFRLVFFGPQGQRSETVQRISVGDGRVAKGKLVYSTDVAQKDENVLGARPPNYTPPNDFGNWRASTQLAYGLTSGLTGLVGGAFVQTVDADRWLATAGLRTSMAGLAVKADAGLADGSATAFGLGIGGRFGRTAITASHTEYSGLFPDETKSVGLQFLRRATELDFNTYLTLGDGVFALPISARLRNYLDVDGRNTLVGGMRASTRLSGLLVSNTLDYSRSTAPDIEKNEQLFGSFDLATLTRGKTRARASLGYQLMPQTDLTNVSLELDHALDERTSVRGVAGYDFVVGQPRFGISGVRDFDRFSLALDANYSFVDKSYFVGLRLGFSLGRDPLRGRLFMARPGLASSGGATVRAFRDLDGDGLYGAGDEAIEDVDFVTFNQTGKTDATGVARLTNLGMGRAISIQMDQTSLPDIDMAPTVPGLEVVPRPGRIHAIDYPVVALSEVEGMARFADVEGERGVSGVRLHLVNEKGEVVAYARTEVDGYYFFERIMPGTYRLRIDPDQIDRLQLCPLNGEAIFVGHISDVVTRDLSISSCAPRIARRGE